MSDALAPLPRRRVAEALGTGVSAGGRGRLRHHGRAARRRKRRLALLANAIPTGATLVVLILTSARSRARISTRR